MDEGRLNISYKILAALLCSGIFSIVYNLSAYYALSLENVPSFTFPFERHIPFIPLFIVPYMTNGLFFTIMCFLCTNTAQLKQYVRRIILLTLIAGLCFFIFPLKFSLPKPAVTSPFLNYFFDFLQRRDTPFNQAPSLHIAYVLLFWTVIKKRFSGIILSTLKIWFILIILSTMFVYQHHLIDVLSAFILTSFVLIITSSAQDKLKYRNQYIAQFYDAFAFIFILLGALVLEKSLIITLITSLIAINLLLVGQNYQSNKSHFLKDSNGDIKIWKKIIYSPYLLIYKLMWLYVRKMQPLNILEIHPQIYISRKLTSKEYKAISISKNDYIIDLSAELIETKWAKDNCHYLSAPILDIGLPEKKQIENILSQVIQCYNSKTQESRFFIHCTMGYSRSSMLAILFLSKQLAINTEEALGIISEIHNKYVIHKATRIFIKEI